MTRASPSRSVGAGGAGGGDRETAAAAGAAGSLPFAAHFLVLLAARDVVGFVPVALAGAAAPLEAGATVVPEGVEALGAGALAEAAALALLEDR